MGGNFKVKSFYQNGKHKQCNFSVIQVTFLGASLYRIQGKGLKRKIFDLDQVIHALE
jgi:hypothetical protein